MAARSRIMAKRSGGAVNHSRLFNQVARRTMTRQFCFAGYQGNEHCCPRCGQSKKLGVFDQKKKENAGHKHRKFRLGDLAGLIKKQKQSKSKEGYPHGKQVPSVDPFGQNFAQETR